MSERNSGKKVPLGRTTLLVPQIGFGSAPLSSMPESFGFTVGEERAKATLRAIIAGPARFIDTSRNYGAGRAETWLGDVLREMGGPPKDLVISTKLDRDPETNRFDGSRARRSLEESLKCLGLEKVHILHLHDPEYAASIEDVTRKGGALDALFSMKENGLADAVGLAAGKVQVMMPLLRDYDFDVIITHSRYSLLNRNADEMIEFAAKKGIAVLNAAVFSSGVLAKGSASGARHAYQELSDPIRRQVQDIEAICARYNVPLGAAALQFSMRDPRIASTICGVSRPERVDEIVNWSQLAIPQPAWDEILARPASRDDPEATRDYQPPS
jgi:D-threo-aldose 1-dehydrogenase